LRYVFDIVYLFSDRDRLIIVLLEELKSYVKQNNMMRSLKSAARTSK